MVWGIFFIFAALMALTCAVQFMVKAGVNKTSISFSLGMLCVTLLSLTSSIVLIIDPDPGRSLFWLYNLADSLMPLAGAASPFFMLVLSRNFGRRDDIGGFRGVSTLTRMAGLITIVALYFVANGTVFESSFLDGSYILTFKGFLSKAIGLTLAVLLIMSLLNFENTRRASKSAMRYQVLIFMIIDIMILAVVVRMFLMGMVTSEFFGYLSPFIAGLLVWLYALLLRKDVYSANVVIDRQAFLSSTVILFLGIFLVLTGIIAFIVDKIGGPSDVFLSVIGAFLVMGLFFLVLLSDSIRGRFTNAMLSRIYAGRFDYKAEWRALSEDFASCGSVNDLERLLVERVDRLFKPTIQMLLVNDNEYLKGRYPATSLNYSVKTNDPLAEWIFLKSEPANFSDIEESAPSKLKELEADYEILVPIIAENKMIGLILLGSKIDSTAFNNEDFAMLQAITHQAAVTILHLRSRDKLLESEKLASFHRTASFVIHDLKNAISMLSLLTQNAPRKMSDPDFQRESIRTIDHALLRMQRIIEKLKTPPDKEQLQVAPTDPIRILYGAIEKSGIVNKTDVEVKILCDEVQPVKTDPGVLETVYINMLINAVEAMPEGGIIKIDQKLIDNKPRMTISDQGIGMSIEFIEKKLFRPFETTKSKGLGVGMYQCREMFKETGGEIRVESEPGKGSTFILIFP